MKPSVTSSTPSTEKPVSKQVSRYHPVLVGLHWIMALMISVSLARVFFRIAPMPNSDPYKIHELWRHVTAGIVIFTLMPIRFIARLKSAKPAEAMTGFPALDWLPRATHYSFYTLIFGMVGTGLYIAFRSGLFGIVYGGSGAPLPESFLVFPTRVAHGFIALTLVGFIALHVSAVLFHQFLRKDGLLRHMSFSKRVLPASPP
jgi:cytochrome b561